MMMKRISGWLLGIVMLGGCQATPRYVIEGNIVDYSGKVFLLSPNTTDKLDTLAEVEARNGNFQITGVVDVPRFAWLSVENARSKIPVFLENTSFTVYADMKKQPAVWSVSGGELQQVRACFKNEVEDVIKEKRDTLEVEYRKCEKEKNLFGRYHIQALAEELDSLYERNENQFIRENDNLVSASLIYARLRRLVKEKMLRDKYELLGDSARNSTLGKILAGYLEKEIDVRQGALVPDFTLQTPEGEYLSLYSVKARVKVVDFWASWCGPCRAENPNVKKLYEKYRDAGLEVISISLDTKKEKWMKAIEQDDLPWIHLSDLQGWESPLVKMFGIQGIPYLLVLDKDNRIIGSKLRGEELDRCVMETMR